MSEEVTFDDLEVELLTDANIDVSFSCSDQDCLGLNNFYYAHALPQQRERLTRTFLFKDNGKVVAYVSLSMSDLLLSRSDHFQEEVGESENYPSIYIARLAVHNAYRGKYIGVNLIGFCRWVAANLSEFIGCKFLVLYTNWVWEEFYTEKCGFSVIEENNGEIWLLKKISNEELRADLDSDVFLDFLKTTR